MKSVIFDFDGTIADTLPIAIECAESVLGDLGLTDEKINEYIHSLAGIQFDPKAVEAFFIMMKNNRVEGI